jgi:ATP-dependent Clp protease ATP-binding subunit ClpA
MGDFERFTEEARKSLSRAQEIAFSYFHEEITPSDLALSLMQDPTVEQVIFQADSGLDVDEVRSRVEQFGELASRPDIVTDYKTLSAKGSAALHEMVRIAKEEHAVWYTPVHMWKGVIAADPILKRVIYQEDR